jgi:glycosyltransferase involved in cell wall biosynthesis
LHVIFLAETDATLRQWRVYAEEIRFSYEVLPSWRSRIGEYTLLLNSGVSRALSKVAPDVIICGGYNYAASWQALRWGSRHNVPFLVWIESTAADDRSYHRSVEYLKNCFLHRASGFMVPGISSFEYVKSFGISENLIFTAPNAVDVDLFSCLAHQARKDAQVRRTALGLPPRYFLFAGRLVHAKGVFDLIEAYGRLAAELRDKVGLVFVGDGAVRAELQRIAAGITPGNIQFPGFKQREDLAKYYAFSEMFVFPTYSDPWGLVVNEAMSCGLPIIVSSTAGCTADLVTDNWNGRVVQPGKVEELAAAMNSLAKNTRMLEEMGKRSRERISGYTPEICAAGIADAARESCR